MAACLAVMLSAFGTCGAAGTKLPVLMYHDLTTDPSKTNSMTVTDERFRLDMEFLQQFGYTPLLPADLINIREGKMQLPDKAVMVTFDDGYRSNYDYAYPVLQNTGMKAAIAVVAHNIRQEGDADSARHNMTWDELREMVDSGAVEVGSHTYNLHNPQYGGNNAPDGINGVMRLKGESRSAYNARVGGDLSSSVQLILTHTGQEKVNYFSYPFGAYDSWMPDLLAQAGIQVSALTNPGLSADFRYPTGSFALRDHDGPAGVRAAAADRPGGSGAGRGIGQRGAGQAAGLLHQWQQLCARAGRCGPAGGNGQRV